MRNKFILFLLVISLYLPIWAQKSSKPTPAQGYKITITIEGLTEKNAFISQFYGGEEYLLDSAKVKKGKFIFQNKNKILPNGIYSIHDSNGKPYFYIIIDNEQNLTLKTTLQSPLEYTLLENNTANIPFFEYQKMLKANADPSSIIETSPKSLLARYLKAQDYAPQLLPTFIVNNNDTTFYTTRQQYEYYVEHYYDQIDFQDTALLYTPLSLDIEEYFTSILDGQDDEFIRTTANNLIKKTLNNKGEATSNTHFYIKKIMQTFMGGDPRYDIAFVFLYDTYCANNNNIFSESEAMLYKNLTERKRRILPGKTIPSIQAYINEKEQFNTAKDTNKYIILWLWDPDCDDCLEQTPKLNEFYRQFHNTYHFEVYAISVTPDLERWKTFITEHDIQWHNATYAYGDPNYDVVDYFDILTTPAIFLLDNNHTIIARHFTLENIYEIFSELSTH